MEKMINYGIDLGTTNSAIAKFIKGEVEVLKNPLETGKETLPSVVYYKKDNIIVGSRARTYLERDSKNVLAAIMEGRVLLDHRQNFILPHYSGGI